MITRHSVQRQHTGRSSSSSSNQEESKQRQSSTGRHYDSLSPTHLSESSSSLLSNTDSSDSLRSVQTMTRQTAIAATAAAATTAGTGNAASAGQQAAKSPILIKYNYYDYNGARQEQPNQDMNYAIRLHHEQQQQQHAKAASVQRQLSPAFKQNLDQIVRNGQLRQRNGMDCSSSAASSVSASPISPGASSNSSAASPDQQQHHHHNHNYSHHHGQAIHFARRYQLSSYEQRCLRCNKTVYQMDKVGPLKDFTFYHQNCFKCRECGTKLTLKTYFNNQQYSNDQEVYCHRHCPKTGPGRLDNQSVGIRAALNAPKVFDSSLAAFRDDPLLINNPAAFNYHRPNDNNHHQYNNDAITTNNINNNNRLPPVAGGEFAHPSVDSRALHIQHAVKQTKLQNIYKQSQVDKKISQFLERRLEYLEPKQKMLEMRHREEEDALFKAFELKWRQEEKSISEQIRDEWQIELNKLLEKYKRQLSNISKVQDSTTTNNNNNNNNISLNKVDLAAKQQLLLRSPTQPVAAAAAAAAALDSGARTKQQMIEFERLNLEKTMTIKLDRKKETLKRKLKEFERQATAELVEKQSREMLALISMKLDEYKEEQKRKIGSDLEHFEAIEKLANRLGSSLQTTAAAAAAANQEAAESTKKKKTPPPAAPQNLVAAQSKQQQQQLSSKAPLAIAGKRLDDGPTKLDSPPPEAPKISKMELYNFEEPDEVFHEIDRRAINVAKDDQQTFTDLVHHLTRNCLTDVEKVRSIFRWITVKNLNTMHFDSSVKPDTPLGLLRGIKNGSESYHVLFKRLCSYAGLHCVVIKGYSKSAGYQPGIKFEGNRFRNSWNAVYVAGAWRFVQCNWGARHLVSVAIMQDKNQSNNNTNNNGLPANQNNGGKNNTSQPAGGGATTKLQQQQQPRPPPPVNAGRSHHHHHGAMMPMAPNHGRRGLASSTSSVSSTSSSSLVVHLHSPTASSHQAAAAAAASSPHAATHHLLPVHLPTNSSSSSASSSSPPTANHGERPLVPSSSSSSSSSNKTNSSNSNNDSLRYEYDDHYFLTDPDEFIYEFYPIAPEWQLLKQRPISLAEFEQLPFVRSLFFKYGLYFPQHDIRSVLYTDSSGATTIKIGMPTHMVPSLIFHYNLKYYDSDLEHHEGVSLKRFVMQSVESGSSDSSADGQQALLSNVVSFRVHLPENGAYILDIFANSTTPNQYITGEPMKFKSVCKFKIVAKNLKTVMIPLPDCASGEYGPMKATRLFGIIPITHENALISIQNDKRFLEIQFRMTRPLVDFMASLHKNGYDEKQLSKSIKIFVDGDIVFVTVKFFEDGQYGLDIYTRDQSAAVANHRHGAAAAAASVSNEPKKQLLTHCCKYLINVRT